MEQSPFRSHLPRELLLGVLFATLLAVFCKTFLIQGFKVPSRSMEPGLRPGDHVLVNKLIYANGAERLPFLPYREVRRGDVVVFKSPSGSSLVKRCVGVPGDRLEIDQRRVEVHGEGSEDLLHDSSRFEESPARFQLTENHYFFLGDFRMRSIDSRDFGPIPREALVGRGLLIYWSIESEEPDIWGTMQSSRRSLGGWFSGWRWRRIGRPIR